MKKFYCEKCKKSLCEEHTYSYVDGNNIAITKNTPNLCKECYEDLYKTKIKTDVDIFKQNLINGLLNLKDIYKMENISIIKLVNYIEKL